MFEENIETRKGHINHQLKQHIGFAKICLISLHASVAKRSDISKIDENIFDLANFLKNQISTFPIPKE